ncbi:MAG: hypothetical protein KKD39_05635 [Candidatus Altiarchaeota archaeon]|nr:hypothetical protein [Candidatus Altiarchaeota archaeon]
MSVVVNQPTGKVESGDRVSGEAAALDEKSRKLEERRKTEAATQTTMSPTAAARVKYLRTGIEFIAGPDKLVHTISSSRISLEDVSPGERRLVFDLIREAKQQDVDAVTAGDKVSTHAMDLGFRMLNVYDIPIQPHDNQDVLEFFRQRAGRKDLSKITPDEKKKLIAEIEAAKAQDKEIAAKGGISPVGIGLSFQLRERYVLPDDIVNPVKVFDYVSENAGLSELQRESVSLRKKIAEVSKAAAVVRDKLRGLRGSEPSDREKKILDQLGLLLHDGEGNSRIDLTAVDKRLASGETIESLSQELGYEKPVRLQLLIERERSKEYLAKSRKDGKFNPFKMSTVKYETLDDLIEERELEIDYLKRARAGAGVASYMQRIGTSLDRNFGARAVDAYGRRHTYGELFQSLGDLSKEDRQEVIDNVIAAKTRGLNHFKAMKSHSRTGVDPGFLIYSDVVSGKFSEEYEGISDSLGVYTYGKNYTGELAATGLIIAPSKSPSTLTHEFRHFEDTVFYGGGRSGLNAVITEISSRMVDVGAGEIDWEEAKEVIGQKYMGDTGASRYQQAKEKMEASVDQVERMQKAGISDEVITSILMHAQRFEDILQWGKAPDDRLKELTGHREEK